MSRNRYYEQLNTQSRLNIFISVILSYYRTNVFLGVVLLILIIKTFVIIVFLNTNKQTEWKKNENAPPSLKWQVRNEKCSNDSHLLQKFSLWRIRIRKYLCILRGYSWYLEYRPIYKE